MMASGALKDGQKPRIGGPRCGDLSFGLKCFMPAKSA